MDSVSELASRFPFLDALCLGRSDPFHHAYALSPPTLSPFANQVNYDEFVKVRMRHCVFETLATSIPPADLSAQLPGFLC